MPLRAGLGSGARRRTGRGEGRARATGAARPAEAVAVYKKHLDADGFPILGSDKVSDAALREAADVVNHMLDGRDDLRRAIIKNKVRLAVMAPDERTTDVPEHGERTTPPPARRTSCWTTLPSLRRGRAGGVSPGGWFPSLHLVSGG